MKGMGRLFVWLLIYTNIMFAGDATIEIVKRMDSAPNIAVQDATPNGLNTTLKNRFFKMLVGDLKVTTHFQVISKYFVSDFDDKVIGSFEDVHPNLIIRYMLLTTNSGGLEANVKLLNPTSDTPRFEKTYRVDSMQKYPFLSHKIISDINDHIGAPSVEWMKRFVIIGKNTAPRQSDIVVADYTLTFQKTVVKGGLNLFPKWANESQDSFYYTSYNEDEPTLYHVVTATGKRSKITSSKGMLVVSDVSKDGTKLLLTMAPNDQADIYMYNIISKKAKRVTFYRGIDVNGGFIDNDKKVVFVSDRLGYPNIFSKSINGRGVEQMVYHGRNNNASTSFENYIVYSSRDKESEFGSSTFNLYLISTKTDYIRQLTAAGKNLFPRFSNDGQSILFIKEYGAQSALGLIRLSENRTFHFPLDVGKIQSIDW